MKFKQLDRTPKHAYSMLRNMSCSLIKHERIYTSYAKAKELRKLLTYVFKLSNSANKEDNFLLQKILRQKDAYLKFKNNLKPRLANYKGREFDIRKDSSYCTRKDNSYKYIVELPKNKKKRDEEKKQLFFFEKYGNNYFTWELGLRREELKQLYVNHMRLTSSIKILIPHMSKFYSTKQELKQEVKRKDLREFITDLSKQLNVNFSNNSSELNESIIHDNIITSNLNFNNKGTKAPQNVDDFIELFNVQFNVLHNSINRVKKQLNILNDLSLDKKALLDYNTRMIEVYDPLYTKNFNKYYSEYTKKSRESKQGIRDIISDLKEQQDKQNLIKKKLSLKKTDNLEELIHMTNVKLRTPEEERAESYYYNNYNTGDESGFSDLEYINNPPEELVTLRNNFKINTNSENIKKTAFNRDIIREEDTKETSIVSESLKYYTESKNKNIKTKKSTNNMFITKRGSLEYGRSIRSIRKDNDVNNNNENNENNDDENVISNKI